MGPANMGPGGPTWVLAGYFEVKATIGKIHENPSAKGCLREYTPRKKSNVEPENETFP